ncbi:MAG TPA: hypothetical protein VGD78_15575 [Chthoniobacterales bacterium]
MRSPRFLLGLACALGFHFSAAANPLALAPADFAAPPSTFYVVGPSGEYVTQGREYRATSADGFEFIPTDNGPLGIFVAIDNLHTEKDPAKQQSYYLAVGAPYHQLLKPGVYLSAYRFPTAPSQAQLDVTVYDRGNNADHGYFSMLAITHDAAGNLVSRAVDFTLTGDVGGRIFGQLRYHSTIPTVTTLR